MTEAWLAIDTGGSKTQLKLLDNVGREIAQTVMHGFGLAVDEPDKPLEELREALEKLAREWEVTKICANLGGKNSGQLTATLRSVFPKARIEVYRESSGFIADIIRREYGADAIALMGTGCIIICEGPLGRMIADGWGKDTGDNGSGYWIGMEAVRSTLTALESNEGLSKMQQAISGREKPFKPDNVKQGGQSLMEQRDEVRRTIGIPLSRAGAAQYCRLVSDHARQGDEIAQTILQQAGRHVAASIKRALSKTGCGQDAKIIVIGGAARTAEFWKDVCQEEIQKDFRTASLLVKDVELIRGAELRLKNM